MVISWRMWVYGVGLLGWVSLSSGPRPPAEPPKVKHVTVYREQADSRGGRPTMACGRGATRSWSASAGAITRTEDHTIISTKRNPKSFCWRGARTAA